MRTILVVAGLLLAGTVAFASTATAAPCIAPNSPVPSTGVPGQNYNVCVQQEQISGCNDNYHLANVAGSQWPAGASLRAYDSSYDCTANLGWYSYRSAGNMTGVEGAVQGVGVVRAEQTDNQFQDSYGSRNQRVGTSVNAYTYYGPGVSVSQVAATGNSGSSEETFASVRTFPYAPSAHYQQNTQNGNCQASFNGAGYGPCYTQIPQAPRLFDNLPPL